jgi:hypothetical protein
MKKLREAYRVVAINLLNTFVLLLVLNLLLGGFFFLKDRYRQNQTLHPARLFNSDGSPVDNGKRVKGNLEWFDFDSTKELGEVAVAEVLDDFYDLSQKGFIYQPWTQFCEPPFAGKRVSVDLDPAGLPVRRTLNPSVDSSKRIISIFVFGGSTTFGYYSGDEHTWPTYLSKALNERAQREGLNIQIQVTNHGHATYFPSQETALCIDVFKTGQRPDLAIFMDGVNWGAAVDMPLYTPQLEESFYQWQHADPALANRQLRDQMRRWFPLYRFAAGLRQRFVKEESRNNTLEHRDLGGKGIVDENKTVAHMIERFRQNALISKSVCDDYGTLALFFLQPDAFYNYPLSLVKPSNDGSPWRPNQTARQAFYAQLTKDPIYVSLDQAFNDFGVNQGKKAVVNGLHYNPTFSKFLAEIVAARIDLKKLAEAPVKTPVTPTGDVRVIRY